MRQAVANQREPDRIVQQLQIFRAKFSLNRPRSRATQTLGQESFMAYPRAIQSRL
jgi:hypothetical protein